MRSIRSDECRGSVGVGVFGGEYPNAAEVLEVRPPSIREGRGGRGSTTAEQKLSPKIAEKRIQMSPLLAYDGSLICFRAECLVGKIQ